MEKNKVKVLYFGLLLTFSTFINPCITSYGLGGDSVELCIQDNETDSPFSLYFEGKNNAWMELFHEGEESYEE